MKVRLKDGTGTVDLKYLYSDRNRHGNERIYVRRRKGAPKITLQAEPGSDEFLAEYKAALTGERLSKTPLPSRSALAARDSFRWLVAEYYESRAYKDGLGNSTRSRRKTILDEICDEKIEGVQTGPLPYALMEAKHVHQICDQKKAPEAFNDRLKALRGVFEWASDPQVDHTKDNPAKRVRYIRTGSPGFHTWTVDEIEQFESCNPVGSKPRLALDLLLYTGVRRSDVIKLGRQHERNGVLRFTVTKGLKRKRVDLALPILSQLRESIDKAETGDLTYLVTKSGKSYSHGGFGNWFKRQCVAAGLSHCSAHGLRKGGATIAANRGATPHQLKAIYGWSTLREANRYTESADRERLARDGMHLVVPEQIDDKSSPPKTMVQKGG